MKLIIKNQENENKSIEIIEMDDATIDKVFKFLNGIVDKADIVGVLKLLIKKFNFKNIKEILDYVKLISESDK